MGGLASVQKCLCMSDAAAHGSSASSPLCVRCPVLTGPLFSSLGSTASVRSRPCVSLLVLPCGCPSQPCWPPACPASQRPPPGAHISGPSDALSLPLEPGAPFHTFSVSTSVFLPLFGPWTPSQSASEFRKHTELQGRLTLMRMCVPRSVIESRVSLLAS